MYRPSPGIAMGRTTKLYINPTGSLNFHYLQTVPNSMSKTADVGKLHGRGWVRILIKDVWLTSQLREVNKSKKQHSDLLVLLLLKRCFAAKRERQSEWSLRINTRAGWTVPALRSQQNKEPESLTDLKSPSTSESSQMSSWGTFLLFRRCSSRLLWSKMTDQNKSTE